MRKPSHRPTLESFGDARDLTRSNVGGGQTDGDYSGDYYSSGGYGDGPTDLAYGTTS
jgi:hypothetical protein